MNEDNKIIEETNSLIKQPPWIGSHYVYVLLDPRESPPKPFYVGKGIFNRAYEHIRNSRSSFDKDIHDHVISVGISGDEIIKDILDKNDFSNKDKVIRDLLSLNFSEKDIVRIVARKITEKNSFALESMLIKHVYGSEKLTNQQSGHDSDRFRDFDKWDYQDSYDIETDELGNFLNTTKPNIFGIYYVYVLRNPESQQIFYVGKGKGNRLADHFLKSKKDEGSDIERLDQIRQLTQNGHRPKDIGRIIARVEHEDTAFMIESFYIKFVVGLNNLTNIQPGHHFSNFRSLGDWEARHGFDISIILHKGAKRTELLDNYVGLGLDVDLYNVVEIIKNDYPNYKLDFGEASVFGASELIVDALIPGQELISEELVNECKSRKLVGFKRIASGPKNAEIRVRIQVRNNRKFQVFMHGKKYLAEAWFKQHFSKLGAFPVNRRDHQYRPDAWHDQNGSLKATHDPNIAAARVIEMIQIALAQNRNELSENIAKLLDAEPKVRRSAD